MDPGKYNFNPRDNNQQFQKPILMEMVTFHFIPVRLVGYDYTFEYC